MGDIITLDDDESNALLSAFKVENIVLRPLDEKRVGSNVVEKGVGCDGVQ